MTPRNWNVVSLAFVALTTVGCGNPNPLAPAAYSMDSPTAVGVPVFSATAASEPATHVTVPVSFAFASGTCGLTTNVSASGYLDMTIHSVTTGSGSIRNIINAHASGTGSGADGSKYVFAYNQTFIQEDASAFPIPIRAIDVFELVGLGDAPNVRTGFVATAEILSNGTLANVDFTLVRGNPMACDPI